MSNNEDLKKKFFDYYNPRYALSTEDIWNWIEDNCLQKQQEEKFLSKDTENKMIDLIDKLQYNGRFQANWKEVFLKEMWHYLTQNN